VVDEAGQATEPATWIALLRARRALLVGDSKQLPPTVLSREAAAQGLAVSLMERAEEMYGGSLRRSLTTQYRMHAAISDWASDELYEGQLLASPTVSQRTLADLEGVSETAATRTPMMLLDTRAPTGRLLADCQEEAGGGDSDDAEMGGEALVKAVSLLNRGEANAVAAHVRRLLAGGVSARNIAVQSPYSAQVELLRMVLADLPGAEEVEVASVDSFQGREADAVIISMVRSNDNGSIGFLADARRLNVAITRARCHVAVVCDSRTVMSNQMLKRLLMHIKKNGVMESADPQTWTA